MVYRRYAGLFFCVCVDANDNELAYLEAIHFFVEVLDQFFGNVCELDLVFNFYKVRLLRVVLLRLGSWTWLTGFRYAGLCNSGRGLPCGRDRRDQQTSRPDKAGTSG